jgi:hypothetical protein
MQDALSSKPKEKKPFEIEENKIDEFEEDFEDVGKNIRLCIYEHEL